MEPEPSGFFTFLLLSVFPLWSLQSSIVLFILLILILCSALVSGSEVAFFSLNASDHRTLEEENTTTSRRLLELKMKPKKLLATILISNNFVNIAIVIVTQLLINDLVPDETLQQLGQNLSEWSGNLFSAEGIALTISFLLTVVLVTFILVLFGEVAPKIYANLDNLRFARFMALPLSILNFMFSPISNILVKWGNGIERRIASNRNYQTGTSKEDLDAAIELAVMNESDSQQDLDILKGIINFGDLSAKQVMKPRMDVTALEVGTTYDEVLKEIKESGFSRIPIYQEDFDNVIGILYVKDLLQYISQPPTFEWQNLIRKNVLFIPESKKIDDLLREFQMKRLHMAIVVNEFGGTVGIITLEDIMEEVIGDIKDEFDEEEENLYMAIGHNNYIFEGKTLLHDVSKIIGEPVSYFDDIKGNADSLGGMIIEHYGHIPTPDHELVIKNVTMKVVSVTDRRIEKINVKVK